MSKQLFSQTTIAVVWDFDKTLIPGYMQEPLFGHFGVDGTVFWKEVNALVDTYRDGGVTRMTTEIHYLNHILDYVAAGRMEGLNNALLKELGASLDFYPGIPELFDTLNQHFANNPDFRQYGVSIEHYVVSTGLRQMILGSRLSDYIEDVWGCELLEIDGRVQKIGYVLDNTSKTRALFEINKGANKHGEIDVNSAMDELERRIPFENMIYLADGPSDVPVFSLLKSHGGKTCGVYPKGSHKDYKQVHELQQQNRVQGIGPADYTYGSQVSMWLITEMEKIAEHIVASRKRLLDERLGQPPKHLSDSDETR